MTTIADIEKDVADLNEATVALRRALHAHPELAFEETWTAATLANHLRTLGIEVHEGIGGTGVLGIIEGSRPGKTLVIRSDMDAVEMQEAPNRPYGSQIDGRNHCCGHDVNSAVVAGVAGVLARHRADFTGRVAIIFQPADEPMRGARRMIDDGLFDRISPDMSLSLHVLPHLNAGQVVVQQGPIWASRDAFSLQLTGPVSTDFANTFDMVRFTVQLTDSLYKLVEEEGKSEERVIFRVRSLRADQGGFGTPGHASLEVNLALYDHALRARLLERINEVCNSIAADAGATIASEVDYALPPLVNDDIVTGALERAASQVVGGENIVTGWRNPFSDDFGLFLQRAPGCLMLLGTANEAKGITGIWHTPEYDADEDAIPIGVRIMSQAALELLG